MHFAHLKRWIGAAALVVAAAVGPAAVSQEILTKKYEPYYEHMLPISQAFGIEMLDARLRVAEAYTTPINNDLKQQLANMATKDLGRFYGTLQQKNAALATELKTAVDAVVKAINDGQPAAALAARARPLVQRAYDVVIDPALRTNLQFKTAVTASLLVAEDGVSEGFEEAVKFPNRQQYPAGWGAWERVEVLWKELAAVTTPALASEGNLLMDNMRPFYKTKHLPPQPFPMEDQEELEALSHGMATVLENLADASLYVGRDMIRLTQTLNEVLAPACADYAAGRDALATERVYAVLEHFVSEASGLAGAVSIMAPAAETTARSLFPRLVTTRYQPLTGTVNTTISPADACRALQTVMVEAKKSVGG
jgi:hypothetical protein